MEKSSLQVKNNNIAEKNDEAKVQTLKSYSLYEKAQKYIKTEGPSLCSKVGSIYNFQIEKPDGNVYITLDLKNYPGNIFVGKSHRADATVFISDDVLVDLAAGKLKPAKALLQKKMTLKGNPLAIMKFRPSLIKEKAKL